MIDQVDKAARMVSGRRLGCYIVQSLVAFVMLA